MSFDAVAPWYQTLERITFGDALQRCRVACLDQIARPERVLIVGEGNGRFLLELLRRHPGIEVDCVDSSERMLELARERIKNASVERGAMVRWHCRDVISWNPPRNRYDLVVTHFILDCFAETQLGSVAKKLGNAATSEGEWLLADFCIPSGDLARMQALGWLTAMYWFFRRAAKIDANTLIDPTPFIEQLGFSVARRYLFRQGMLKSELWHRS